MLTALECRTAQPKDKPYKLHDQGGLFLLVLPSGTKTWRQKFRFAGREKQLTHGRFPMVSLKEARILRDQAKRQLFDGIDPARVKAEAAIVAGVAAAPAYTFTAAFERWHTLQAASWKPKHARYVRNTFMVDVLPALGETPLTGVRPRDVRPVIEAIQQRGAVDRAHRVLSYVSNIFQVAIADDLAEIDPAASLRKILKPVARRLYRAIVDLEQARAALLTVEAEPHWPATKLASRLLALTASRPGPLRLAQAAEFHDLDGPEPRWIIPAAKMKLDLEESLQGAFDFAVPLSRQAVATVRAALTFSAGRPYLFPSVRIGTRPMSDGALAMAYRRCSAFSGRHVPHGWRSTFSTIMNERAQTPDRQNDRAIIDLMLAHKPTGTEAHYNRATFMPRRRELAQEWADLLTEGLPLPETLLDGPRN